MSSVCTRGFAQVAPKKNFVVDVVDIYDSTDIKAYGNMFLQSDFDEWYAANRSAVTQIGSVYVVNSTDNFIDTVDGSNAIEHTLGRNFLADYNKHTLTDMGKEICIGIPSNPRLLVFRQVALPFSPFSQGTGVVGYVVTENSASNLTRPRFRIAVSRV